jgi:predicted RNA-binding Zn-ribbon protein involved in translation (DUF1610 family)
MASEPAEKPDISTDCPKCGHATFGRNPKFTSALPPGRNYLGPGPHPPRDHDSLMYRCETCGYKTYIKA